MEKQQDRRTGVDMIIDDIWNLLDKAEKTSVENIREDVYQLLKRAETREKLWSLDFAEQYCAHVLHYRKKNFVDVENFYNDFVSTDFSIE